MHSVAFEALVLMKGAGKGINIVLDAHMFRRFALMFAIGRAEGRSMRIGTIIALFSAEEIVICRLELIKLADEISEVHVFIFIVSSISIFAIYYVLR